MSLPADLEAALLELPDEELAALLDAPRLRICTVGQLRPGKSGVMAANFGDGAAEPPDDGEAGSANPHGQET
jgi:hypothetical protein